MSVEGSGAGPRTKALKGRLWSIVLAGGEGSRTREFIRRHLGVTKPKQYCSFVGTRSLLQHTIDRADRISSPERRVIVAAREHRHHALLQTRDRPPGTLLFQPDNHGTAPGVFLPLTHVIAKAPEAIVVIYPSDHFVQPEPAFHRAIADGVALADALGDRLVLLGVSPDSPETEYGWIQPGNPIPGTSFGGARDVASFIEKPTQHGAESAFRRGALWNTSIVIGRAKTLWGLASRYLPEMMALFVELRERLGREPERLVLDRIYREMPKVDFSRDLLQVASRHLSVMKLEGVLWSDWGSPRRILDTLALIGARGPASGSSRVDRSAEQRGVTENAARA
jgi:mannose-1-phosphate guanylyltransferase